MLGLNPSNYTIYYSIAVTVATVCCCPLCCSINDDVSTQPMDKAIAVVEHHHQHSSFHLMNHHIASALNQ